MTRSTILFLALTACGAAPDRTASTSTPATTPPDVAITFTDDPGHWCTTNPKACADACAGHCAENCCLPGRELAAPRPNLRAYTTTHAAVPDMPLWLQAWCLNDNDTGRAVEGACAPGGELIYVGEHYALCAYQPGAAAGEVWTTVLCMEVSK